LSTSSPLFPFPLPRRPPSTLFPYTTLFRSPRPLAPALDRRPRRHSYPGLRSGLARATPALSPSPHADWGLVVQLGGSVAGRTEPDRKSTRLTPVTFRSRMPSSA